MEEYGENNLGEGAGQDDLKALQKLYSSEVNFDGYEVVKVIGRGSYAKVYLIKGAISPGKKSSEYYALKVLKKKDL